MILSRIKRGAARTAVLAKHNLTSLHTPKLRVTWRTPQVPWQTARTILLNALVVQTAITPIPLIAPASAEASLGDEPSEPPTIVRVSGEATDALTFTDNDPVRLAVRDASLQPVAVGKSIAAEKADQSRKLAEDARARAEAARKRQAQQTRILAAAPMQPVISMSAAAIMDAVGIPESDRFYVNYIVNREAGWGGTLTYNRGGSGAYGICQALPGSKMASAGADWRTNPVTQLRWCDGYAKGRYGSWAGAYRAWIRQGWW